MGSRIAGAEDARQHQAGVARSELPGIGLALLGGQLGTLLQGRGHASRVHQQVVLGQEAGEQHAVPLHIGDLLDQQREPGLAMIIAKLLGARAQGGAQAALLVGHGRKRVVAIDSQRSDSSCGGALGLIAGIFDAIFERAAQVRCERCHGMSLR